jgi:hypothetical protein
MSRITRAFRRRWGLLTALVGLGILGLALLALGSITPFKHMHLAGVVHVGDLFSALGEALIVAAILGGSVDFWFKRELTRDAFSTALGFLLREELRPELQWLYRQEIVAREHHQTYKLTTQQPESEPDDLDLVTLEIYMDRQLENISNTKQRWQPPFGLDRWGIGKDTRILELGWKKSAEEYCEHFDVQQHEHEVVGTSKKALTLYPGETCVQWCRGVETKRLNDATQNYVLYATSDPEVSVDFGALNSKLEYEVKIGNWRRQSPVQIGEHKYSLKGTLLPTQAIQLRWWASDTAQQTQGKYFQSFQSFQRWVSNIARHSKQS